ncbi:hypothetical protein CLAIMM_02536 [Cladophialophora immunda]|nr:hypothetical protein CLAIMM_02536 [Cladophialophora immunda]
MSARVFRFGNGGSQDINCRLREDKRRTADRYRRSKTRCLDWILEELPGTILDNVFAMISYFSLLGHPTVV